MNNVPFQPDAGANQIITVGAAVNTPITGLRPEAKQVSFLNTGANVVHVRVVGRDAASLADFPIPSGGWRVLTKADGTTAIAAFSTAGTTLHVCTGEGWGH